MCMVCPIPVYFLLDTFFKIGKSTRKLYLSPSLYSPVLNLHQNTKTAFILFYKDQSLHLLFAIYPIHFPPSPLSRAKLPLPLPLSDPISSNLSVWPEWRIPRAGRLCRGDKRRAFSHLAPQGPLLLPSMRNCANSRKWCLH